MKKILITGISGFVGPHLARECLAHGYEVHGWVHPDKIAQAADGLPAQARFWPCDLTDADRVSELLGRVRPDGIFHLAAKSHVGDSWNRPRMILDNNAACQVNLLEAVCRHGMNPRIVTAGSSEAYGIVAPADLPVSEDRPLNPASPYATSKAVQDDLAVQYHEKHGLDIVRARSFNQTGPGRSPEFVTAAFCLQIARIEAGLQDPVLWTGNLESIRDFMDVRDGARAYRMCLEKGVSGEAYNLCSGRGVAIRGIADILRRHSTVDFDLRADFSRTRPSDIPVLIGSGDRLFQASGFKPRISLEDSLWDLLEEWRRKTWQGADRPVAAAVPGVLE